MNLRKPNNKFLQLQANGDKISQDIQIFHKQAGRKILMFKHILLMLNNCIL